MTNSLAKCDECGFLANLNEFGLCHKCNVLAERFADAAMKARARGHDPFKAGMIAQAQIVAEDAKAEEERKKPAITFRPQPMPAHHPDTLRAMGVDL